jgi:hypothetical protein
MEATHQVTQDVFDPATGEKRLVAGQRVKAINLGDHYYVWQVPMNALAGPVSLEPWMVSRSLMPIDSK